MDYQTLATQLGHPAAIAATLVWGQWLDAHHYTLRASEHGGVDIEVVVEKHLYVTFHVAANDADTSMVSWEEDGFSEERYVLCSESSTLDDGSLMTPFDQLMLLVECCDTPSRLKELSVYIGENYSSLEG